MLVFIVAALADTFWDIPPANAARLHAALHPGDVLLRWCAGCGDPVGTYSEGKQVQVRWEALAIGPASAETQVYAAAPVCASDPVCLPDPAAACADRDAYVDIPYTWRRTPSGRWEWVGTLAGLEGEPFPAPATPAPDPAWIRAALACAPVVAPPPPPTD